MWIEYPENVAEQPVEFCFVFSLEKSVVSASLKITARGVYAAALNGERIGSEVLAPGWTDYKKRLQYQVYDAAPLLRQGENRLSAEVGLGWFMHGRDKTGAQPALFAELRLVYADGTDELLSSDEGWRCRLSKTRYSNIYNGESYDASFEAGEWLPPRAAALPTDILIPREGERIVENERLAVRQVLVTPEGKTVLDFGQNLTGYVEFRIQGPAGAKGTLRHAEVLDAEGNFYTANLRGAKQQVEFTCDGNEHVFKPKFCFMGFRYIQPENWPCEIKPEDFTAIVVHSEMKRTGRFECSEPLLNRLFENIVWGQKSNFLDVPTDCPQRDERMGWTGDAQIFCRTASYLFDVERFFTKWLADLASEQLEDGGVPHVIPKAHWDGDSSTGWADAAVICPWQMYLSYGDKEILRRQFDSMKAWVDYMLARAKNGNLLRGKHFGDWLCLDLNPTPNKVLRNAYFAYSTEILIKAGEVLGIPMEDYKEQLRLILANFRKTYIREGRMAHNTQTACALALYFGLAEGGARMGVAAQLAKIIRKTGHIKTGFLGTPYLLHALSANGCTALAYDLLLRREYPSWLYPVTQGATTIWERWDGQRPDGSFQDTGMNSFNHYAYGAVGDWLLGVVCGIQTDEKRPGFRHIIFAPQADPRLGWARGEIETRHGLVRAGWRSTDTGFAYEFTVPEGCTAEIRLDGEVLEIGPGTVRCHSKTNIA